MVLDEAFLNYRRDRLYAAINDALESGDKDSFRKLSEEWNTLKH